MSKASEKPQLTPQLCFDERALRDFLRISRSAIDDSIVQNLNALLTPSKSGFDPSTTSQRQTRPSNARTIDSSACSGFKEDILFPSWQSRSDVLNYCASVATSEDPEDPDLVTRQAESLRTAERVVDERLDPYSARYFPREARTESLAALIRNERAVEDIVRHRTWGVISERCGGTSQAWEEALNRWRDGKKTS